MNSKDIIKKLSEIKNDFRQDGVLIVGLFGSYAENLQKDTSDIDILIETTDEFVSKHDGFEAFEKLEEIKTKLSTIFHKNIDLADKKGFKAGSLGDEYIVKKAIYV